MCNLFSNYVYQVWNMKNEVKHALLSNIQLHSLYFPNSKINSIKKAIFNAFARILENQNFSKKNLFLSWPNLTLINISNHSISNKNYRKFNIIKMFYQRIILSLNLFITSRTPRYWISLLCYQKINQKNK